MKTWEQLEYDLEHGEPLDAEYCRGEWVVTLLQTWHDSWDLIGTERHRSVGVKNKDLDQAKIEIEILIDTFQE